MLNQVNEWALRNNNNSRETSLTSWVTLKEFPNRLVTKTYSTGSNHDTKPGLQKLKSNNYVILEKFFVEESSNLIGWDNFGDVTQEPDFSKTCSFHRKWDHQHFHNCAKKVRINTLGLTFSWWRSRSYKNHSIDFLGKSMDWFLYDRHLRHERVNDKIQKSSYFDHSCDFMDSADPPWMLV